MIKSEEAEVVKPGNSRKSGWGTMKKNAVTYREGMKVEHADFGTGEIVSVNDSTSLTLLQIRFYKDPVPKTLAAQYTTLKVL